MEKQYSLDYWVRHLGSNQIINDQINEEIQDEKETQSERAVQGKMEAKKKKEAKQKIQVTQLNMQWAQLSLIKHLKRS